MIATHIPLFCALPLQQVIRLYVHPINFIGAGFFFLHKLEALLPRQGIVVERLHIKISYVFRNCTLAC